MSASPQTRSDLGLAVQIDRIRCTGHGICATLLPEDITLDEWGYPIVAGERVDPSLGETAVRLCPAAALRLEARARG